MNSVNLIGRLTKDPQERGTETKVASFSIAIDTGYGDSKRTDYPNIVCFGKTAENCLKYLQKGSQVGVIGRLQTGSYEKDGVKHYTTDVIASRVEFLSKAKAEEEYEDAMDMVAEAFHIAEEDIPF